MDTFDFIVIGGGSAGAVVAARLSEDPAVTVLLLEAGSDDPSFTLAEINVPAACGKLQRNPNTDWEYKTTPQGPTACKLNKNQQSAWPRGKVLGGSSSINYMAYVRGTPSDYNSWAKGGATGWSYNDVKEYFLKSEDCRNIKRSPSVHGKIDSTQHGVGGPLTTCFREPVNPISEAFVAACNDAGHQTIDYNSGAELGASLFQQTVRDGQRCHTAMAFLKPARERANNLTINTHCHVAKVVVEAKDDGRKVATGVQCYVGKGAGPGSPQTLFRASKEVIVSGGAIGSPQILQLSGIGDQELLKAVGIPLVHHLPGVGANLQDHLMLPMLFRPGYEGYEELTSRERNAHKIFLTADQRAELTALKKKLGGKLKCKKIGSMNASVAESLGSVWSYLTKGEGPLVSSSYDAHVVLRTGINDDVGMFPDVQIGIFVGMGDIDVIRNFNYPEEELPGLLGADEHDLLRDTQGFTLIPTILHPRSRGTVKVTSSNPFEHPEVNPNYLSHPKDVETIIAGVKHAFKLATEHEALSKLVAFSAAPPIMNTYVDKGINVMEDDAAIEELARSLAGTIYHPTSTCRIGDVVDPSLCVKGIENLRVIDASVMPHLPSANTNAPTIMIGEKGAAMIVAKHKLKPTMITKAESARPTGSGARVPMLLVFGAVASAICAASWVYFSLTENFEMNAK